MIAASGNRLSDSPQRLESSLTLFRLAKEGDRDALERLYARYVPRLTRWASGRLAPGARQLQDTSDIVQEVLVRFIDRMEGFEPDHPGALMGYLRTAILNRIRDAWRTAARHPAHDDIEEKGESVAGPPALSPYEQCIAKETAEAYEQALASLTDEERTAVILKIELDCDNAEIANELGKPSADAARMFVHRTVLKLARQMARADKDLPIHDS